MPSRPDRRPPPLVLAVGLAVPGGTASRVFAPPSRLPVRLQVVAHRPGPSVAYTGTHLYAITARRPYTVTQGSLMDRGIVALARFDCPVRPLFTAVLSGWLALARNEAGSRTAWLPGTRTRRIALVCRGRPTTPIATAALAAGPYVVRQAVTGPIGPAAALPVVARGVARGTAVLSVLPLFPMGDWWTLPSPR